MSHQGDHQYTYMFLYTYGFCFNVWKSSMTLKTLFDKSRIFILVWNANAVLRDIFKKQISTHLYILSSNQTSVSTPSNYIIL